MKNLRQRIAYWLLGWKWPVTIVRTAGKPRCACLTCGERVELERMRADLAVMQERQQEAVERLQTENWDEE